MILLTVVNFLSRNTKLLLEQHVIYVYKASAYPLPINLRAVENDFFEYAIIRSFKIGGLVILLCVCVQIGSQNSQ